MKHKIYKLDRKVNPANNLIKSVNDLLGHLSPKNYKVDKKRFRDLLNNNLLDIYLLETDGKIVGMGSLHYFDTLVKKSVWIEDVVVHPDHRRNGYGKKIIKHIINQAKKKGAKHVDLSSRNDRAESHKFYQKLKFEKRDTSVYRRKLKRK
jgi:N-acetylglutamate synthase-like GNAT family acetyltransferase